MSANSVGKIGAGLPNASGGVYMGVANASGLPTDSTTAVGISFIKLGLVSDDGLKAAGDRKVESIKDWSGDIIAQLQTEHSSAFSFTLYQVYDADVQKLVFGDPFVTVTPATSTSGTLIEVQETGAVLDYRSFVFDMKNGEKTSRFVLPYAQVSEVKEQDYVAGKLQGFDVTVTAFKDDSGVKVYRYYDDGVFTA